MVLGSIKRLFYKTLFPILIVVSLSESGEVLVDRVIASVNGEPILESELRVASLYYGISDRKKLIDKLVDLYLVYTFLKGRGAEVPESYIDQAVESMAKMNGKTVEEFYKELYSMGVTPKALKDFLEKEMFFNMGLQTMVMSKIDNINVEEYLSGKEKRVVRKIKLLAVPRDKAHLMAEAVKTKGGLEDMARVVGEPVEELIVGKGELVKPLDTKVWNSPIGLRVFAEDERYIYIAEILEEEEIYGDKTRKEIEREILVREFEKEKEKLLKRLRTTSVISVVY